MWPLLLILTIQKRMQSKFLEIIHKHEIKKCMKIPVVETWKINSL